MGYRAMKKVRSDIQRFLCLRHQDMATGCWNWTGSLRKGYPSFRIGSHTDGTRKLVFAYRFIWEQIHGPVPKGMQLHHICENIRCVNPDHLEMLTVKQHVHKSPNNITHAHLHKTHCKYGHEFTPENTYIFKTGRACRQCRRMNWHLHEQRQRIIRQGGVLPSDTAH